MKVAVSIPDDLFAQADAMAGKLGTSRSELYARALTAFVGYRTEGRLTEDINAVLGDDDQGEGEDRFLLAAARASFARNEW